MDTKLRNLQSKEALYNYLDSNKHIKKDILESKDLKAIIDAVDYTVQRSIESAQNFLLQKRFNLFYNYYPYFFQHIPNHAIVEVLSYQSTDFIDLELGEEFILKLDDENFRFQAAIPFSLSPFQVTHCFAIRDKFSIEIDANRGFKFDRNHFLLSINPSSLSNYQIYHLIETLKNNKSCSMTLFSNDLSKPIIIPVHLNFDIKFNIDISQEIILKSLTQAIFSYFYVEFDDLPEEYFFTKIILEIEIPLENNISKPLANNSIKTNLLPVFNLFNDFAMKINCDYSKESYGIRHLDCPRDYIPTKLCSITYNKQKVFHSYLNINNSKSYNLIFEPTGHLRIALLEPSLEDLSQDDNEIVVYAQWTQASSANVDKKDYEFLPLSRSIGNLKFNVTYSYGFKRNKLLERADNILKVLNIINATGLNENIFNTLISLVTNDDKYAMTFIINNLVNIQSREQFNYDIYIKSDLSKLEFVFYVNLVYEFLNLHLSRKIGVRFNLDVKVI